MKLIFLGSGAAFTVGANNFHSNMILEDDSNGHNSRLLVDCGSDVRFSLHELGLTYRDIEAVYISHLHADHAGGLEWLSLSSKFDQACSKPTLYVNEKTVHDLWSTVLAGGLSTLHGVIADLSTYFNVCPIKENGSFSWRAHEFKVIQTVHIMSGFALVPSYGLLFKADGITVFLTTDTQFSLPQLMNFYQTADFIFHDCETSANHSGVHAHYNELTSLPNEIKQKMWLYHYNPGELPDARKEGFLGFVKKGQAFDFSDKKSFLGAK